jgi:predicted PurR-regulated permease PerM
VATPPHEPTLDAAHKRALEALARYAPAEPRALGAMAAIAAAAILAVILPVGVGVLLGALLAFTVYGRYRKLARRTGRPSLAAFVATLATTLAVAGTLGVLASLLVVQGVSVLATVRQWFDAGGGAAMSVSRLTRPLAFLGLKPHDVVEEVHGALGSLAASVAGGAAQALGTLFDSVLALFFMALTMHLVLRSWDAIARRAACLLPINPHHTRRLMREMRRLGRTVVIGNFGTAIIQGLVAGVGYAIGRVPSAAFFGAITAVASLVPVFGTMLVWVPAGLVLLLGGHAARGAFELLWGAVAVVGVCDYLVRPKLVGRGEPTSAWMTCVALFGGIKLFGFVGVLLGPLLVGLAASVLRMYARPRRYRLGLR